MGPLAHTQGNADRVEARLPREARIRVMHCKRGALGLPRSVFFGTQQKFTMPFMGLGENIRKMSKLLRTLRAVQWAMLLSIVLYGVIGELTGPRVTHVDQTLSYIFTSLSVGIVGMIFIVRRTLVLRAQPALSLNPEDALSLNHWKTGYIATYALCEALALFGLVLRIRGSALQQSLLFYAAGFTLMLFFRPIRPAVVKAI